MQQILNALVVAFLSRDGGGIPAAAYKNLPDSAEFNALKKLNITLRGITGRDSEARFALVSALFDRPITSTYQLTVAEIKAFLAAAYPKGGLVPDSRFHDFLSATMEELYDE